MQLELCCREKQRTGPRKYADIHADPPGLQAATYPRLYCMQRGVAVVVAVVAVVADGGVVAVAQGGKVEGFLADTMMSSPLRCRLFPENHPDRCGSVRNPGTSGSGSPALQLPAHHWLFVPNEENI